MTRTMTLTLATLGALAIAAPAYAEGTASDTPATTAKGSESLSTKLSNSNGVIKPTGNVDPEMHVPAPDPHPNSTPVIPPHVTGGNTAK